jgi:ankyrin repeat protein
LISHGADINFEGDFGSPIRRASESKNREIVDLLLARGAMVDLSTAAFLGDITFFEDYLAQGNNINSWEGSTPLKIAILYGCKQIKVLHFLIDQGADIDAEQHTFDGTALHLAAKCGNQNAIILLLQAGAKINSRDINGQTPLHRGVYSRCRSIVELLIQQGADIEAQDYQRNSSLCIAVTEQSKDIVQLLIQYGADVNGKGGQFRSKDSLLHISASNNNTDIVELLLKAGADANAKSGIFGYTPLYYTSNYGLNFFSETQTTRLLKKYGSSSRMYWWAVPMHVLIDILSDWGNS